MATSVARAREATPELRIAGGGVVEAEQDASRRDASASRHVQAPCGRTEERRARWRASSFKPPSAVPTPDARARRTAIAAKPLRTTRRRFAARARPLEAQKSGPRSSLSYRSRREASPRTLSD